MRGGFGCLGILLAVQLTLWGAGPRVTKVEPPDWWQQTSEQALRVLLTGHDLGGVAATVTPVTCRLRHVHASANGHYLFLTLTWTGAPPSRVRLHLKGKDGATDVPFRFTAGPRTVPAGFGPDDVFYLIMVDRFATDGRAPSHAGIDRSVAHAFHGGDLGGIRAHLGYLKDLGVTTLWLTPIYANAPPDYHGYGTVDYYAVDPRFGSLGDLQGLIRAAHAMGLKVVQDQVANHTGPQHSWMQDWPTPTWYHGTAARHLTADFDYPALTDARASEAMRAQSTDGWFGGKLPDLNQEDPEVARYEIQNSLWWLGRAGFEGIRQDTFPMMRCGYLTAWRRALQSEFPGVTEVGEVFHASSTITSYFEHDCAVAAPGSGAALTVFDYPLYFALRDVFLKDAGFSRITEVLAADRLYRHPERLVTFLGNHDVMCLATAAGATTADPDAVERNRIQLAFVALLTLRGTPQIYAGDEMGMTGGNDPDNRHDFPGGFPGDARSAFSDAGRTASEAAVFVFVRSLLHLRQFHAALRTGSFEELRMQEHQFAYLRTAGNDRVLVAFNTAEAPAVLDLTMPEVESHSWRLLQSNGVNASFPADGHLKLPPHSVAIWGAQ